MQFIQAAFALPTHTYGTGADSPALDAQCASKGAMRATLIAASGADILGAAGQIEVAAAISPVQLIIDDEVLGMVRRVVSAMNFDDENLAWEELLNVAPGGEFLTSAHTLRHCRDGLPSVNFIQSDRESWQEEGRGDLVGRATEFYHDLLQKTPPLLLGQRMREEMESITQAADARLQVR